MVYEEGASDADDRPAHVRAASGLSAFREHLAVIQDDANWLALIDKDQRVRAVPLPTSPKGERVFSKNRGNRHDKYDLEACVTVPCADGHELVGFSSGSRSGREWILRVSDRGTLSGSMASEVVCDEATGLEAAFLDATPFYDSMRANAEFCGPSLNIEGALGLEGDLIRVFQRGNALARDGLEPTNATGDISWGALCRHLADPENVPPPPLQNIRVYELGQLDDVRLTYSDAEYLGEGRVLFSASAEDPESSRIAGSVLGVIEANGHARWTELIDADGQPFRGKIEGLTRDSHAPNKIYFVIDDDDEAVPSKIYEAEISSSFLCANEGNV
jgi:hypothetical protein